MVTAGRFMCLCFSLVQLAGQRHLARVIHSAGGRDRCAVAALLANNEIDPAARRRVRQFGHATRPALLGAKINIKAIWIRRVRVALRLTLMVEPSDFDLFHG